MTRPSRPHAARGFLIAELVSAERLPADFAQVVELLHRPIADQLAARQARLKRPMFVGLCGAQGSGKSTAALVLKMLLESRGLRTAVLSIDDVYLSRKTRVALSRSVHPLLVTRGPPGTHDLGLLSRVIDWLLDGQSLALPSFDKAADDRRAEGDWPWFEGPADVVLLEGWCVGAAPQPPASLADPINDLERYEDPHGIWRRFANAALDAYQPIFRRIDLLMLMRPPDFETVVRWRCEQEAKLRLKVAGRADAKVMSQAELARFVQHYERLTRHVMSEMPGRADLVIELDGERRPKWFG